MNQMEHLKYPIGRWQRPESYSDHQIHEWIQVIRKLPGEIQKLLEGKSEEVFMSRYRPEGWTLRQLIHHIADSHINAYIRHKLTYTENQPRICPYLENSWADLRDVQLVPVQVSVQLLDCIHQRWVVFLEGVNGREWELEYLHPQHQRIFTLQESLSMYAWHSQHHLAHIKNALTQPY